MATSSTFEIMNDLLCAIKQIDIITGSDQDNIIEEALIATKAINIDKFSEDIKKNIVDNIRLGLVNMYKEQQMTSIMILLNRLAVLMYLNMKKVNT